MLAALVIVCLVGAVVGTFFGMFILSLGIIAKRNVSDMPEVPISQDCRQVLQVR